MPYLFANFAALLIAFLPGARGQSTYQVTEVPLGLGGILAAPVNLTENGQIAFNAGGQAYVWSPAGLRSLSPLPGFQAAYVYKVHDDGQAFGRSFNIGPFGQVSSATPMTWTADGVAHALRQPSLLEFGGAVDANARDQIIGFGWIITSHIDIAVPVLWWQRVQMYLPIPSGSSAGHANSINQHGMIVGSATPAGSIFASPVVWNSPSAAFFPVLPPECIGGELQSVNNVGQAVGFVSTFTAYRAAWYDQHGLRMLDNPAGYEQSFLNTINRSGQAVGRALSPSTRESGILLIDGQVELIGDRLDPVTGAGWNITDLPGLNNHGQMAAVGRKTAAPFDWAILLLDPLP